MTKKEDIFQGLVTIIMGQLGDESKDKFVLKASFLDDLGADSLDIVEIVMAAEEEFGVSISEAELEKIDTVGDLVDLIMKKLLPSSNLTCLAKAISGDLIKESFLP